MRYLSGNNVVEVIEIPLGHFEVSGKRLVG